MRWRLRLAIELEALTDIQRIFGALRLICRSRVQRDHICESNKLFVRCQTDGTSAAALPEAKRTSALKAEIASRILACAAADGERDEKALRAVALLAVAEDSHYSHDIPPERRIV